MTETELAAWLRALPMGTVLVDDTGDAWQLLHHIDLDDHGQPTGVELRAAHQARSGDEPFDLDDDEDIDAVIEFAPFTVVYMPPVGMPEGGDD